MIYYDRFETWATSFGDSMDDLVDRHTRLQLASTEFEFIEDAGDFVSQAAGTREISIRVRNWILEREFCVFHGTRLLPDEVSSINACGLKPLIASHREERIRKILRNHEKWKIYDGDLAHTIYKVGPGEKVGRREGQIHFSLSWSGLVKGFNHYLEYGSEFDQRVSQLLLGDDSGLNLLRANTSAYVVHVRMTGKEIIEGAHPYISYDDVVEIGEVPGLGRTFLNAWAFKKSAPNFELWKLQTDCCMMLNRYVSPEDVLLLEKLD